MDYRAISDTYEGGKLWMKSRSHGEEDAAEQYLETAENESARNGRAGTNGIAFVRGCGITNVGPHKAAIIRGSGRFWCT